MEVEYGLITSSAVPDRLRASDSFMEVDKDQWFDLVEYSKQHEIDTVFGSKMKASVKEGVKLEWDKTKLEKWLKKNKLYEEYSSLNTFRLNSEVKKGNKKLDKFAKKDKSFSVRLSKGI